jgi:toxin ParE1/3/4
VRHKVVFRPEAENDLFALYSYIAEKSGHARAGGYIARIEAACLNLAGFSERGSPRDDLAPGIRILSFERRVVIAFRVRQDVVRIVRVFYAGRDFQTALEGSDDE